MMHFPLHTNFHRNESFKLCFDWKFSGRWGIISCKEIAVSSSKALRLECGGNEGHFERPPTIFQKNPANQQLPLNNRYQSARRCALQMTKIRALIRRPNQIIVSNISKQSRKGQNKTTSITKAAKKMTMPRIITIWMQRNTESMNAIMYARSIEPHPPHCSNK